MNNLESEMNQNLNHMANQGHRPKLTEQEKRQLARALRAGFGTVEAYEESLAYLLDECRFAKMVETAEGVALYIAGDVIQIKSRNPSFHVDVICSALRHRGSDGGSSGGSTVEESPATSAG
jgi:hypothetical protein